MNVCTELNQNTLNPGWKSYKFWERLEPTSSFYGCENWGLRKGNTRNKKLWLWSVLQTVISMTLPIPGIPTPSALPLYFSPVQADQEWHISITLKYKLNKFKLIKLLNNIFIKGMWLQLFNVILRGPKPGWTFFWGLKRNSLLLKLKCWKKFQIITQNVQLKNTYYWDDYLRCLNVVT